MPILGPVEATSFDNIFNLITEDITLLEIKENSQKDNCSIRNKHDHGKYYNSFVLDENTKTKIICEISFYPSSVTRKYLPRLTFKKTNLNNETKDTASLKPIIISFRDSKEALIFWKFIAFLYQFKDIVDLGEFDSAYRVLSKDRYFIEFETKGERERIEELKELILKSNLKENDIKSIVFENRKRTIKAFLYLLKNTIVSGKGSIEYYREKYNLEAGEETIWHHFLKSNDWILGLNVDIKFIRDFYDEQKIGFENSRGRGNPKVDLLGISDYTTLIELKHSNTDIFRKEKNSKSRANTWDFSSDFIEGVSQCLGQKTTLEKHYETKTFLNASKERLDKSKVLTFDPKTVFIIGNRKREFPHNYKDDHYFKSQTFELFRRNTRNVDIITYDELFERAYHIVFSVKANEDWFSDDQFLQED